MKKSIIGFLALSATIALLAVSCGNGSTPPPDPDPSLTITGFAPLSARAGETLVISGRCFRPTPAENSVMLNTVSVPVVSATESELQVVVPDDPASTGTVTVTAGGESYTYYTPRFTFLQGDVVYAGGFEAGSMVYWRNGISVLVGAGTLRDIFVSNSNVYIAGTAVSESVTMAALWVNGTKTLLGSGPRTSLASSVFVSGGHVYVAGTEYPTSLTSVATYWKDGNKQALGDDVNASSASVVTVRGTDVYVAGYEENGGVTQAVLWVNGTKTVLSDGDNTWVSDLFIEGNDVYVVGVQDGVTNVLWKNNVKTVLSTNDATYYVSSVYVSGDDIYQAGSEYTVTGQVATLWKNGTKQTLGGGQISWASRVFVAGSNVYVVGQEWQRAVLWKNGEKTYLSEAGTTTVSDLYVVPGQY